jgi:hypothetical protein
MDEPRTARDRLFAAVTVILAVLLLLPALAYRPRRALELACQWALGLRFPAEDLTGLTAHTRAAFTAARTDAFWRYGQLIGLTSGHRDPAIQQRLFDEEVRRSGSPAAARLLVLPPAESRHVKGIALDVRPREGALWLEEHGARYDLYRTYDNEWWHFEHRPEAGTPPRRLPHPAGTLVLPDRAVKADAAAARTTLIDTDMFDHRPLLDRTESEAYVAQDRAIEADLDAPESGPPPRWDRDQGEAPARHLLRESVPGWDR